MSTCVHTHGWNSEQLSVGISVVSWCAIVLSVQDADPGQLREGHRRLGRFYGTSCKVNYLRIQARTKSTQAGLLYSVQTRRFSRLRLGSPCFPHVDTYLAPNPQTAQPHPPPRKELSNPKPREAGRRPASSDWAEELSIRTQALRFLWRSVGGSRH